MTSMSALEPPTEVRRALLRLHARTISMIALVVMASALVLTSQQQPVYVSEAVVSVGQRAYGTTVEALNIATEREIARSSVVADEALKVLGDEGRTWQQTLSVEVPLDTAVLRFTYGSTSAEGARRGAQAFADAYVAHRVRTSSGGESTTGFREAPQVITPAVRPERSTSPDWGLNVAVALVTGLLLGLVAAFLRDRYDDRVRSSVSLGTLLPDATVVDVPLSEPLGSKTRRRTAASAPVRYLATRMTRSLWPHPNGKVLVAGTSYGAPTSALAWGISSSWAGSGRRVVLITPQSIVEAGRAAPDLAAVLSRRVEPLAALQPTDLPGLYVIRYEPTSDELMEQLSGSACADLFRVLQECSDVVVLDAAGPLAEPEAALALAPVLTMCVLAAPVGSLRRDVVRSAQLLHEFDVPIVGCAVVYQPRRPRLRLRQQREKRGQRSRQEPTGPAERPAPADHPEVLVSKVAGRSPAAVVPPP